MSAGVKLLREGGIARIILARPDVGNALDIPAAQALMQAAIECDEDADIRCVVLTGEGRMFCAGGDVKAFAAAGERLPMLLKEITTYVHSAVSRLARMNKPLVTVINGPAAGAGFSLSILGDIALAAESASFTLAYSAIGLTPDGGATWLLPRLIGMRAAQEMALLNRRLSAAEAAQFGLITRAVADDKLNEQADELVAQLSMSATRALGATRRLLLSSFETSLEAQMEQEARAIAAAARTDHGREGIAAFLDRRRPQFNAS